MAESDIRYLCECGNDGLAELARTRIGRGLPWKQGLRQTVYFLCLQRNTVYQGARYGIALESRGVLAAFDSTMGGIKTVVPYTGHLTWEQIIRNAENCIGAITADDESRIEQTEERLGRIAKLKQ